MSDLRQAAVSILNSMHELAKQRDVALKEVEMLRDAIADLRASNKDLRKQIERLENR